MNKKSTFFIFFFFFSISIFSQAPVITKHPSNQSVITGQTATFMIEASGDSLTYQWYKNGAAIGGAIDSIYTQPATILADNGSKFSVKVSNSHGSDSSNSATLLVTLAGNRVTHNQILFYNFKEGIGDVINDNSGVGTAYNLGIDNPSTTIWTPNGLGINDTAFINADLPATKVIDSVKSTNEFTFEAWLYPVIDHQKEGARIATISQDISSSNFSLIQMNQKYYFKLRTSTTDDSGEPALSTTIPDTLDLIHLVFTRTSNGTAKIYVNGVEDTSGTVTGNFSNWNSAYRLQIANEFGSALPWLGTYYLLSVYNRALNQVEIQNNYNVGTAVDQKPEIIIQPKDLGRIVRDNGTFSVSSIGNTPLTYQWLRNGGVVSGATSSSYTINPVWGDYNGDEYSVIVTNNDGADTSRIATLFVTASNLRVTNNQILYYNFQGVEGDSIITDSSGFETPLNLDISNPGVVEWKPFGLVVTSSANIVSTTNASKVSSRLMETGEFTFETWVKPEDLIQSGASLFTISNSTSRNFKVFQNSKDLQVWLRTSTLVNNGAALNSFNSLDTGLIHIVYIHNTKEVSKIYINGVEVSSAPWFTGDLSNWDIGYFLRIANEFGLSQPWKGIYNLISIYDRALDINEIVHNYSMGPLNVSLKSPGNLIAQTPHARMVQLAWKDSSNNEEGFIIERETVGPIVAAFEAIDSVTANDTTYIDLGVIDTTTYKYRVKAYSSLTESGYSNEVTITTFLSTIAAPSELTAMLNIPDTTNVDLAWVDNSTNELGFIIQRKLGDTSSTEPYSVIDSVDADVVIFTDSTVSDTTTYTYRVYAYNADTVSAFSNLSEITTPLPVELTSFTANMINGNVLINWITSSEINNAGFSLQRSNDNQIFSEITFIKGKGTTTDITEYSYKDKSVLSGKYYYRLKQVDFNGSFYYSNSIEIDFGLPKNFALDQNYPNPFNPTTTIRFALPTDAKVNIKLFNTLGQEVAIILNNELDAGVHETNYNASDFSSGVYFYRLEAKSKDGSVFAETKRMILIK